MAKRTKMMTDLKGAAHLMGVRTSTLLALAKPVKGCVLGEAGLKYVRKRGKYSFALQDVAEWLRQRLRNVNQVRKQVGA